MFVWLDDDYEIRKGWFHDDATHCYWPEEVIELLKTGKVETLSLDHDLGETYATESLERFTNEKTS